MLKMTRGKKKTVITEVVHGNEKVAMGQSSKLLLS